MIGREPWAFFVVVCLSVSVAALILSCHAARISNELAKCGPEVWDCGE